MSKYIKLIEATTPYATQMNRLSNRIFGNVVRKTDQVSMKTVKMFSENPLYLNDRVVNYYPRLKEINGLMLKLRNYGLFRDEHEDFKDEMKRLRKLRGKVKPKKGQGKQALNKK